MSREGDPDMESQQLPLTAVYRQLDDHLSQDEEPYDVGSGLERLVTWMSEDAPSSAAQPRQRGRAKKTSASSAHGDEAYRGLGGAAVIPLSDVRFLTVAEVALVMRVSKMTVYRLVHSGELETIRVGRSFRVPEAAVNQYLRAAFVGTG